MTPPIPPPDDREARLTALLLGELSPAEAEALRQELAADPQLHRLHDELAATLQLVRDAVGTGAESEPAAEPQPLRLQGARREKLLASFRVVPTRPSFWKSWARSQRRELASLAAMLAGLLGIAFLLLHGLRPQSRDQASAEVLRLIPDETSAGQSPRGLESGLPLPPPVMPEPAGQPALEKEQVSAVVAGTTVANFSVAADQPVSALSTPPVNGPAQYGRGNTVLSSIPRESLVVEQSLALGGAITPAAPATPPPPASTPAPAAKPARPAGVPRAAQVDSLQLNDLKKKPSATEDASADTLRRKEDAAAENRFAYRLALPAAPADKSPAVINGRLEAPGPAQPSSGGVQLWDTERRESARPRPPWEQTESKGTAATDWFYADGTARARSGGFGGGGGASLGDDFIRQPRGNAAGIAGQVAQGGGDRTDARSFYFGTEARAKDAGGLAGERGTLQRDAALKNALQAESLARGFKSSTDAQRSLDEAAQRTDAPHSASTANATRELQRRAGTGPAGERLAEKQEVTGKSLNFAGRLMSSPQPANAPVPQPEVVTADNAFSTFSLNVSDVSFQLAAASLEQGRLPEAASIRVEEFINAFDYRDPEPGGSAPVALAWERARSPWAHDRDVMRFAVKTAASGRQAGRPLNLVLALDNSGSMERADRVRILQECLRVLAAQLRPGDRVSLVAFARTARLVADGLPGERAGELTRHAAQLSPQGGTNLEDALALAWQTARRQFLPQGVNRVVLLTDGAANLGEINPASLKAQVETQRRQGIALDCFGIGWEGYDDELLEQLSRNGDGRYGFINSPAAAASDFAGQLAGALQVAASDVKVQVEWNPRRVRAWRQIGYARHQLTREQFRDNTVDAAELGAAEAGNALYTVQVDPAGEGPLGTARVRFKLPGTSDYRELEWTLPHDGSARSLDQASPSLRLAATAGAFGEWLAASPFAAEATPDRLLATLRGVPDSWAADPRPAQLQRMLQQAQGLGGK